MVDQYKDI